jgi:hypothetical protein
MRGSEKLFPLFPFSNLLIFFDFIKCKGEQTNMQWKRRKENGGFGGERENSNANGGKENGITTGLPLSESFTFVVCEQDCRHTFED